MMNMENVSKKMNPLVAMVFNLCLPVAAMLVKILPLHIFFMIYVSLILIYLKKYKRLLKLLIVYCVFHLAHFTFLSFDNNVSNMFAILFYITIQFYPSVMISSILFIDYTSSELLSSLQLLHLPKIFIISITVIFRYFPIFKKEFIYIKESMRLRNIAFTFKKPLKSFEYFIVPQLFRCSILAEELTGAGLVKGIDSKVKRSTYYDVKINNVDIFLFAILLFGIIGVKLWVK